jgi:hypothetical protein
MARKAKSPPAATGEARERHKLAASERPEHNPSLADFQTLNSALNFSPCLASDAKAIHELGPRVLQACFAEMLAGADPDWVIRRYAAIQKATLAHAKMVLADTGAPQ